MENFWITIEVPILFLSESSDNDKDNDKIKEIIESRSMNKADNKALVSDVVTFEVCYGKDTITFHPHADLDKTLLIINSDVWKVDLDYIDFKTYWEIEKDNAIRKFTGKK